MEPSFQPLPTSFQHPLIQDNDGNIVPYTSINQSSASEATGPSYDPVLYTPSSSSLSQESYDAVSQAPHYAGECPVVNEPSLYPNITAPNYLIPSYQKRTYMSPSTYQPPHQHQTLAVPGVTVPSSVHINQGDLIIRGEGLRFGTGQRKSTRKSHRLTGPSSPEPCLARRMDRERYKSQQTDI